MAGPTLRPQVADLFGFDDATRLALAVGVPHSLWIKPAWRGRQGVPEQRIGRTVVFPRSAFREWTAAYRATRRGPATARRGA
jgi:hypothetical protein